jgi:hypothetical protein
LKGTALVTERSGSFSSDHHRFTRLQDARRQGFVLLETGGVARFILCQRCGQRRYPGIQHRVRLFEVYELSPYRLGRLLRVHTLFLELRVPLALGSPPLDEHGHLPTQHLRLLSQAGDLAQQAIEMLLQRHLLGLDGGAPVGGMGEVLAQVDVLLFGGLEACLGGRQRRGELVMDVLVPASQEGAQLGGQLLVSTKTGCLLGKAGEARRDLGEQVAGAR